MECEPAREASAPARPERSRKGYSPGSRPQTEAADPREDALASFEALTRRFDLFVTAARVLAQRRRRGAVPYQEIKHAIEHETRQPFTTTLLGIFLTVNPGLVVSVRCGAAVHDLSLILAADTRDATTVFRKRLAAFASSLPAAEERAVLAQVPVTSLPLPNFSLVFDEASGRLLSQAQHQHVEEKTYGVGLALARLAERKTWKRDLKRPRQTPVQNQSISHPEKQKENQVARNNQDQFQRASSLHAREEDAGNAQTGKRLRGLEGLPATLIAQVRERARIEHEMSASEVRQRQRRQARASLPSFFDLVYLHFRTARRQSWEMGDLVASILNKRGANTYGPAIKNTASKVEIIRAQLAMLLDILPDWCFLTDSQAFPGQKIFNVRKGKPAQIMQWRRQTLESISSPSSSSSSSSSATGSAAPTR